MVAMGRKIPKGARYRDEEIPHHAGHPAPDGAEQGAGEGEGQENETDGDQLQLNGKETACNNLNARSIPIVAIFFALTETFAAFAFMADCPPIVNSILLCFYCPYRNLR